MTDHYTCEHNKVVPLTKEAATEKAPFDCICVECAEYLVGATLE